MTSLFIPGVPAPQGSKRHVGNGRLIESSKLLPAWRATMTQHLTTWWAGKPALDVPVEVTAIFHVPRPKRPKFDVPATRPDTDKYQRALGDSLEASGVLKDDARITTWHATKQYAPPGKTGVTITINQIIEKNRS